MTTSPNRNAHNFDRGEVAEYWNAKFRAGLKLLKIPIKRVSELTGISQTTLNKLKVRFPRELKFAVYLMEHHINAGETSELNLQNKQLKKELQHLKLVHYMLTTRRAEYDNNRVFFHRTKEWLMSVISGEVDAVELAKAELAKRGFDEQGVLIVKQKRVSPNPWTVKLEKVIKSYKRYRDGRRGKRPPKKKLAWFPPYIPAAERGDYTPTGRRRKRPAKRKRGWKPPEERDPGQE
jgi:hypothetical protein